MKPFSLGFTRTSWIDVLRSLPDGDGLAQLRRSMETGLVALFGPLDQPDSVRRSFGNVSGLYNADSVEQFLSISLECM